MRDAQFPDALPVGSVIAGYEIKRVLGQGGFGIAYEGYNADLGSRAAIKEFFPRELGGRDGTTFVATRSQGDLYGRLLDKFIDEARTVRTFNHPNIVKVLHLERANNTAYMIMDFVEGGTLDSWARAHAGKLDAATIRATFIPVIEALETVHAAGKLHRDISPMNILVDKVGKPFIIDFGAAKQDWQASPSASTLLIAHPHYAPPERMIRELGNEVAQGPAVDVYSLGAVMYETIAGDRPTAALTRQHLLAMGRGDSLRPLAEVAKVPCPKSVTDAIDTALSFDSLKRPQSMAEFRTALGWGDAATTQEVDETERERLRKLEEQRQQDEARRREEALKKEEQERRLKDDRERAEEEKKKRGDGGGADKKPPDDWDKIKSPEPTAPRTISAWIAGLPEGGRWWTPPVAAILFLAASLCAAALSEALAPQQASSWTTSVFLFFFGLSLVVPPALILLLRVKKGVGLFLAWSMGMAVAATPVVRSVQSGHGALALLVIAGMLAQGIYLVRLRLGKELEFALFWQGLVGLLGIGFAVALKEYAANVSPGTALGSTFFVALLFTAMVVVLRKTPIRSQAMACHAITLGVSLALFLIAALGR
ncbi:MAG: protein kinase [Proteobacteria bacterium]|nr:protein kinase [Pseudomonadota bacterium]